MPSTRLCFSVSWKNNTRDTPFCLKYFFFSDRTTQVLLIPFVVLGIFAPEIFGFIFGEKWIEAGRYAQIILPWIFMVSLVMPLSFIPDLYKKQRVAMIIDGIRLVARLGGLGRRSDHGKCIYWTGTLQWSEYPDDRSTACSGTSGW